MDLINSTEKVMKILNFLSENTKEIGITDIAKELEMSKSGVHKIITTLQEGGFIVQNLSTRKYGLGPALLRLGSVYTEQKKIYDIAYPIMKEISNITNETVALSLKEGNSGVVAYRLESDKVIKLHQKMGTKYPINAGATGKLLGAYQKKEVIEKILKKEGLKEYTHNTIMDSEKLFQEYEKIREKGYAISDSEKDVGNFAISAPIYDNEGEVWSCLTLVGLKKDFPEEKINDWIQLLVNGALEISYRLGY